MMDKETTVTDPATDVKEFADVFNESVGVTTPTVETSTVEEPIVEPAAKVEESVIEPIIETPKTPVTLTQDFESLYTKEVQRTKSWEGRLSASERRNKELETELQELKKQPTIKQDTTEGLVDVDDPLIKTFIEEMGDDFIKPLGAYVKKQIAEAVAPFKSLSDKVPALERTVTTVKNSGDAAHYTAILDAHSDVAELLESGEIDAYVEELPYKEAVQAKEVLEKGTARQVIKFLDGFKEKTGKTKPATPTVITPISQSKVVEATVVKGGYTPKPKTQADASDFEGAFKEAVGS